MKRLLITSACCLALGGCGLLKAVFTPAPSVQVSIAQTDAAVDEAYSALAQAYIAALPSMSPQLKATLKPLMAKAWAATSAVDQAATASNASDVSAKAGAAMSAIADAKNALGIK
jgi:hypothetical protein